jgi:transposase-like protein
MNIRREIVESIQRYKGSGLTMAEVAEKHKVSAASVFRFWKDDFIIDKPRAARRASNSRCSRVGNKYIIDNQTDLTLLQCAELVVKYNNSANEKHAKFGCYKIQHKINNRSDAYKIDYDTEEEK